MLASMDVEISIGVLARSCCDSLWEAGMAGKPSGAEANEDRKLLANQVRAVEKVKNSGEHWPKSGNGRLRNSNENLWN